jgi:hypothetical protein
MSLFYLLNSCFQFQLNFYFVFLPVKKIDWCNFNQMAALQHAIKQFIMPNDTFLVCFWKLKIKLFCPESENCHFCIDEILLAKINKNCFLRILHFFEIQSHQSKLTEFTSSSDLDEKPRRVSFWETRLF